MKTLHTIKLVSKEDGTEVVYKEVAAANYYGGCELELRFADGTTATFDADKWELWDLTPQRGWNENVR